MELEKPIRLQGARYKSLLNLLTRSAFVFLFVYTASAKLFEFTSFRDVLFLSPLIGRYAGFYALAVPTIELIAVGLLLYKGTEKAGMYSCFFLMVLFSCYIGYMLLTENNLPCSCGGVLRSMSWPEHLVFNLALALLALVNILVFYNGLPRGGEAYPK
jgi:putative oxidoreductase